MYYPHHQLRSSVADKIDRHGVGVGLTQRQASYVRYILSAPWFIDWAAGDRGNIKSNRVKSETSIIIFYKPISLK
jgi:hypothetical protein